MAFPSRLLIVIVVFDVAICKQQYNDDNLHLVNGWDRFEECCFRSFYQIYDKDK